MSMAGEQQVDLSTIDTSDPEKLAAIFDQLEKGEDIVPALPVNDAAKVAADAAEKSRQAAQASADDAQLEKDADGIATKDGKHVIPYSVLKSERDRAARAEQVAREAQEKVAALEAQVEAAANPRAKPGGNAHTTQAEPELSDDDLEALKEDFPSVYKAVVASMSVAKALEAKLKPMEDSVREQEQARERTVTDQVQEAVDATPKLAHIAATDPEAFELAKQFDKTLRGQKAWQGKPLTDRFAKVVELVEQANGGIKLPAQQKSAEELKKEAQAVAAAAAKTTKTNVPTSLSEFPVGDPPVKDEAEAVENMTSLQLAEKMGRMTPDQLEAYMRNL
jgi:hypothetical protein